MNENKISESVKRLLYDRMFILWILAPTEEINAYWEKWINKHPEELSALAEATQIIKSLEINKHELTNTESCILYTRLKISLKNNKKKQIYLFFKYAAACVILLCITGTWVLFYEKENNNNTPVDKLVTITFGTESQQTEVELILNNQKKITIANESTIKLDKRGEIHVDDVQQEEIALTNNEMNQAVLELNTLTVPNGRRSSLVLADGTKVWLNSGTTLRFPSAFNESTRTIYVEGEIYLEVVKDMSCPFHVKTSLMDICVLGTSFNVTAYGNEVTQSVVLVEGSVEVSNNTEQRNQIYPAEMLVLQHDKMIVSKVNVYDYTSWKDGVFQFEEKSLNYVIQRLSRYYRLNFVCEPDIQNYVCTGKLVLFDNIANVMTTLVESFPISYEIQDETIKISNNIKKQKPMK